MKLTGKLRWRRSWLGKLILQVEVEDTFDFNMGRAGIESEQVVAWKDAGPEDIIFLHGGHALASNTERSAALS